MMELTSSLFIYISKIESSKHIALRLIPFGIGVPKGGMPLQVHTFMDISKHWSMNCLPTYQCVCCVALAVLHALQVFVGASTVSNFSIVYIYIYIFFVNIISTFNEEKVCICVIASGVLFI